MAGYWDSGADRIETNLTSHADERTYACWTYREGDGGFGSGRVFEKSDSSTTETLLNTGNFSGAFLFRRDHSSANGEWYCSRPAGNSWHHVAVTYNSTSTSNDPLMYIDGTSQSVTEFITPSGTLETNAVKYTIGNRTTASTQIDWDGALAEFAIWSRILTPAEVKALGNGLSPLFFPDGLDTYYPMIRDLTTDFIGSAGSNTGVTVTTHPRIIYPSSNIYNLVAAGGAPAVNTRRYSLTTLSVG